MLPKTIVGWNLPFDSQFLPDWVFDCEWIDGMVLHGLLYPDELRRGLKYVGPKFTGAAYSKTLADGLSGDEMKHYLATDIYQTGVTTRKLLEKIEDHPSKRLVPWIMELTKAAARMSKWGAKVDKIEALRLATYYKDVQTTLVGQMEGIAAQCGSELKFKDKEFTYSRSTQKIHELVFGRMGLPETRTAKGGLSLDKAARSKIEHLDSSGFLKRFGAFLSAQGTVTRCLAPMISNEKNWIDPEGFIHPVPHIVGREADEQTEGGGTVTGRITWKDPPLQVYESEPEEGDAERLGFTPQCTKTVIVSRFGSRGRVVSVDLSQAEPTLIAWLADEEIFKDAFRERVDFYKVIVSRLLKMKMEDVTPGLRRAAKTMWLAMLYGAGADKIQFIMRDEAGINVPIADCRMILKQIGVEFKNLVAWREDIKARVDSGEYIVSPNGRARKFRLDSDDIYRQAINYIPQGFASDINHAVLLETMRGDTNKVVPMFTVHDSIVFDVREEVPDDYFHEFYSRIPAIISEQFGVDDLDVPIRYEIKSGPTWK